METFTGFEQPKQNWSKLPHQFIEMMPLFKSMAELKVVLYTMRHTWGYQNFDKSVPLTTDEYMNGRKRRDGSRIDNGTGLSKQSVITGLKEAEANGFIVSTTDETDKARIAKTYMINMAHSDVKDLDIQEEPDVKDLDAGVKYLDSDSLKVRQRTDKETIKEKEKETVPPLFLPSAADRNGWNRKPKQFIDGIASQVESFGITMVVFRVLVDHILAKHGKLEIANVDTAHGNTALTQAQECALNLLAVDKDTFGTVDGIDSIYQSWKSNDYRGATLPTLGQLVDHAGLMKANQVRKAALTTANAEQDASLRMFRSIGV